MKGYKNNFEKIKLQSGYNGYYNILIDVSIFQVLHKSWKLLVKLNKYGNTNLLGICFNKLQG